MKIKTLLVTLPLAALLSACGAVHTRFLKADVIGFSSSVETSYNVNRGKLQSKKVQTEPYDLTTAGDRVAMHRYIQTAIPEGEHSAVFYAMEMAGERVQYIRKNLSERDPETTYYIFLLTDGFDNASAQVAKNDGRNWSLVTFDKYQKRVRSALRSAMSPFSRNTFEVYPMIFKGAELKKMQEKNGMSDEEFLSYVSSQMDCFRFSSKGREKAPQIICSDNLDDIYAQLYRQVIHSSYRFRVPTAYIKKRIQMNFVNKQGQQASLSGVLKKKGSGYILDDLKLDGINVSTKSKFINRRATKLIAQPSTDPTEMSAAFLIEDIRDLYDLPYLPDPKRVDQEVLMSGNLWYINPDFADNNDLDVNCYFVFVIDGCIADEAQTSLPAGQTTLPASQTSVPAGQTTPSSGQRSQLQLLDDLLDALILNRK